LIDQIPATDRVMAEDLAAVAAQIFDPVGTTLQINAAIEDPLRDFFITKFSEYGFGIQYVSADQGSNFVSYARQASTEGNRRNIRFSLTIGAVVMARDYLLVSNNRVAPASRFNLSGTRATVTVDEKASANKRIDDAAFSAVTYIASLDLDTQAPVISLVTQDLVSQIASGPAVTTLQGVNSSNVEVNNLFYSQSSTFSSLLDSRDRVDRQIIVFGNDSMILGNTNKLLIDQFVANRLGKDDLISLVGCSNGPTALAVGNEGLALGRAQRVTEALLARGVARERILDEGCWAPVSAGEKFPSRGVVLELWREQS